MIKSIPGSQDLPPTQSTIYVLWDEDNGEQKRWYIEPLWNTTQQTVLDTYAIIVTMMKKTYPYTPDNGDMPQTATDYSFLSMTLC